MPPRSPFGLIQEDLVPNEWLILASCILLNCTSRMQVDKIMSIFIKRYKTPQLLLQDDEDRIKQLIGHLGFKNRRTKSLKDLAGVLITTTWDDPRTLPGIGEYGARAWEIFYNNILGKFPPNDGALKTYWNWRKLHEKNNYNTATCPKGT